MAMVYMSPDPYFEAFEEVIDLRKFDLKLHRTAGLCLAHLDNRLFLGCMTPGTPGAKIPHWRSRLKGAWLIKEGDKLVSSIADAQNAFTMANDSGSSFVKLLFTHPKIRQDISHDGLPIVSSAPFSQQVHDQINKHWDFSTVADYLRKAPPYQIVGDGDVLKYVTRVMKLTRGKLLQQDDWTDWQASEYLQLDQYDAQGMFGTPVATTEENAILHLVWTYAIKLWIIVKRLVVSAMDLLARVWFVFWQKPTPTVSTKQVPPLLGCGCRREPPCLRGRHLQRFCQSSSPKTGIFHQAVSCI